MSNRQAHAILVTLVLAATPALATTVTYSDYATWNAATTGVQLITFDSLSVSHYSDILQMGVDFTGLTPSMTPSSTFQVFDTSLSMFMNFGTLKAIAVQAFPLSTPPYIHIQLPSPVTAIALNLFTYNSGGGTFSVTTPDGTYQVPTFAVPTLAFWGITSATPFSTLDIGLVNPTDNQTFLVDNFRFGTASAPDPPPADTPEAATFLLIGSGLVGLRWWGKRRDRAPKKETLNVLTTQTV